MSIKLANEVEIGLQMVVEIQWNGDSRGLSKGDRISGKILFRLEWVLPRFIRRVYA